MLSGILSVSSIPQKLAANKSLPRFFLPPAVGQSTFSPFKESLTVTLVLAYRCCSGLPQFGGQGSV